MRPTVTTTRLVVDRAPAARKASTVVRVLMAVAGIRRPAAATGVAARHLPASMENVLPLGPQATTWDFGMRSYGIPHFQIILALHQFAFPELFESTSPRMSFLFRSRASNVIGLPMAALLAVSIGHFA